MQGLKIERTAQCDLCGAMIDPMKLKPEGLQCTPLVDASVRAGVRFTYWRLGWRVVPETLTCPACRRRILEDALKEVESAE